MTRPRPARSGPPRPPALVIADHLRAALVAEAYTPDTVPALTPDNGLGDQGAVFQIVDQRGHVWRIRINRA